MEKVIDCLFIGHNEMNFWEYEKNIRSMGVNSRTYRDLNLNFIVYNKHPYTLPEIFNIFHYHHYENNTHTVKDILKCFKFTVREKLIGSSGREVNY